MALKLLSEATTTGYGKCPSCKSDDVKGPIDTPTGQRTHPPFYVIRAYFCRKCWWDTSVKLRDDVAEGLVGAKK